MKKYALTFALALFASQTWAYTPNKSTIFYCKTTNNKEFVVERDKNDMVYRFGKSVKKPEITLRQGLTDIMEDGPNELDAVEHFHPHLADVPESYQLNFRTKEYLYIVYFDEFANKSANSSGVEIDIYTDTPKDPKNYRKLFSSIDCKGKAHKKTWVLWDPSPGLPKRIN